MLSRRSGGRPAATSPPEEHRREQREAAARRERAVRPGGDRLAGVTAAADAAVIARHARRRGEVIDELGPAVLSATVGAAVSLPTGFTRVRARVPGIRRRRLTDAGDARPDAAGRARRELAGDRAALDGRVRPVRCCFQPRHPSSVVPSKSSFQPSFFSWAVSVFRSLAAASVAAAAPAAMTLRMILRMSPPVFPRSRGQAPAIGTGASPPRIICSRRRVSAATEARTSTRPARRHPSPLS